eukprot:64946_1
MQPSKWDRGIEYIQKGCDKHEAGDRAAAAKLYERGIQFLLNHVKSMPASNRKFEKQQQIDSYLKLLADLRPEKNQYANSQPYKRAKTTHLSNPSQPQYKQNKPNRNRNMNQKPLPRKKPRSKHDQELYDRIESEIMSHDLNVSFSDVIGLENVKQALLEAVILPAQRPDIFIGARAPPKGLLLFGPPGNGKTFIAKALATECEATFFSISSSSLTSRYVGEGEKLVRALFECARDRAPSIIFIDEIDSLLTSRGGKDEQESSRRMKTEFLVQFDGVQSGNNEAQRVLLVGATNLPWELDDAALRRFPKRILVDKPGNGQREYLMKRLLGPNGGNQLNVKMKAKDIKEIVQSTHGYSASDIRNLVSDAAMGPVRELGMDILDKNNNIPPVTVVHFRSALQNIKPSTTRQSHQQFLKWNMNFGTVLKLPPKKHKNTNVAKKKNEESSWFSRFG